MRGGFILLLVFASVLIKAQSDSAVFSKLVPIETSDYVFMVPAAWKEIPEIDMSSKNKKFDLSNAGLPAECNYSPVTATCALRKYECKNAKAAEDYVVAEMTSYLDRETQPGRNYETDSLHILSGENGTLYTSRFVRHSKHSNFSRYDLIVYSEKRKAAYIFCVTFQYKDPTYNFETKNRLKEYARRFFSTIQLR